MGVEPCGCKLLYGQPREIIGRISGQSNYWETPVTGIKHCPRHSESHIVELERRLAADENVERDYREMCGRLHDCVKRHGLGLGGENLDKLVVEALDRYAKENKALREEYWKEQMPRDGEYGR